MEIATILSIGKLALKLGSAGFDAYVKANRENADVFKEEQIQVLLDDHRDTADILADAGVDLSEG